MIAKELRVESFTAEGLQFPLPARNVRASKTFAAGEDLSLSFDLDRDTRINYRDVAYGNEVVLRRGLNAVWRGSMREITQAEEVITVGCSGQWAYLEDKNHGDNIRLWCDNRYGKWNEANRGEIWAGWGAVFAPEKYEFSTRGNLFIAPRKNERFTLGFSQGAVFYYTDAGLQQKSEIHRVSFDYDVDLAWTTNFQFGLYSITAAAGGAIEWTPGAGAVSAGVKDITIANPGGDAYALYFMMQMNSGPWVTYTGETGEDVYAQITNLRIWGQTTESASVIHVTEETIDEVEANTPIDASHDEVLRDLLPVRDTFTDANGTLLTAHRPDVDDLRGGWAFDLGQHDIQGNQANNTIAGSRTVIDSGLSDCVVCCDCETPVAANWQTGIIFRWVDANNWWALRLTSAGNLEVRRVVAGVGVTVATIAVGCEQGFTYHLMVRLRGDEINSYLGGVLRDTQNDTNMQTATHHGLFSSQQIGMRWDNFEVFEAQPLWPLFYEEGESCYYAIKDCASFGDWDYRALGWGVETGADRVYLRKADRESVRYVIPAQFCRQLSSRGQTQRDFYTSGWFRRIDRDGHQCYGNRYYVHVTGDGLVVNQTATGDDLASVVYGVDRDHVFDFGRVDGGVAREYLIKALQEQGHPQVQSMIEVYGPVKDLHRGGALIEPVEMEMGYLVRIPRFRAGEAEGIAGSDLRDWDTTFLMVGLEVDVEQGIARLIPEGAQEDLQRMIKAARRVVEKDEKDLKDKRSRVIGG